MPSKNPTAATPEAVPAETKKPAGKSKGTVLIVEDEKPLAHALEMKLKSEGYDVHTCMNGMDALAEMKKGTYRLMLLDLIMPSMDGFAVLTELQAAKSKIPVIVLSNLGQDEDVTKAKQLGAVDYCVKSNTPIAEIVRKVKAVI